MRKLIVLTFITLDGVMQAPGGPGEDDSGGFKYGGWSVPYFDEFLGTVMTEQMGHPFDLLLGRKTGQRNTLSLIGPSALNGKRRSRSTAMLPGRSSN